MTADEKPYVGADTLNLALKGYVMEIKFVKKDGTVRKMNCTRHQRYHPEYDKKTDKVRKLPDHLISVVDVDINEWRTINADTIFSARFLRPASE